MGYNFKLPLIFYKTLNNNSAITYKVYIEQILEVEVKKWIKNGDRFILEEDRASRYILRPLVSLVRTIPIRS